jgi:hypothetical protein
MWPLIADRKERDARATQVEYNVTLELFQGEGVMEIRRPVERAAEPTSQQKLGQVLKHPTSSSLNFLILMTTRRTKT